MEKKSFVNRFGLIALMSVSLFASTAFAGNAPAPTQVVITNTPAQPVPMVGLVKDSDAAARKPFQWNGYFTQTAGNGSTFKVITVPPNQRLVIEQASGFCGGGVTQAVLWMYGGGVSHWQWLPSSFANGTSLPASASVRFYVDPGADFSFYLVAGASQGTCNLSVSGYYVDLP